MNSRIASFALAFSTMLLASLAVATDWSTQDYDLYPGDFDGDGKTDILYIAKAVEKASGIARSDGVAPNQIWQSWPSNYFGIQWYGDMYVAVVADFNNDSKDDVLLQRRTPGDSYLLLADTSGRFSGISQTIGNSQLGLTWSLDQHRILAGDFNGDGRSDLFFQAVTPSGTHAVVLADAYGTFTSGPTQTWTDSSWSAFKWSSRHTIISVGDFNGDSRADLLLQRKPDIVMIDYEIPIPVPVYPPNSFGVVLSQGGSTPLQQVGVQQWSRSAFGVDWSPSRAASVIGDFNGDGRTDVLLQARTAGTSSYLLNGNSGGAAFSSGTSASSSIAISADGARLVVGNFDGFGGAGVYVQSTSPSGTNYVANSVGSSIPVSAHDPGAATGTAPVTAVGATPGAFDVTHAGAASYRIPIQVPAGINGIQPNLSFTYSSHRDNSWLGMGWTIAGLSQISRCAPTVAQDGFGGPVGLTDNDRYCLDGNKLRLLNAPSFAYGQDGSVYATEVDSFSRTTGYGSAGTVPGYPSEVSAGPAYFVVESKDGLIYQYGGTVDSRIEAIGSVVPRAWLLNRVTDRAGNAMTITYEEDGPPYGSARPSEIYYTANANAGVAAAFKVKFYWEARPSAADWIIESRGGPAIRETKRLDRIETFYGTTLIRKYDLSYQVGARSRSQLIALQECGSGNSCLSPTTFGWQDGRSAWTQESAVSAPGFDSTAAYYQHVVDMDGDGFSDVVYPSVQGSTRRWYKLISNGSGFNSAVDANFGAGNDATLKYTLVVPLSTRGGSAMILLPPGRPDWLNDRHWLTDIDGDGQTEVLDGVVSGSSMNFTRYEVYSPIFAVPGTGFYNPFIRYQRDGIERFSDFNGDGKTDLILENGTPQTWTALISTASGTYVNGGAGTNWNCTPSCSRLPLHPADFNGDGFTDLIVGGEIRYGSANGLGAPAALPDADQLGGVAADVDGDGRAELLFKDGIGGYWKLMRWNGASFESAMTDLVPATASQPRILDINGDGLPDITYMNGGGLRFRLHEGPAPDLMVSAMDGFGNRVSIGYAAPSDDTAYARASTASTMADELDVLPPRPLVKEYRRTDGTGGQFTVSEKYVGARRHKGSRGFLGFALREETDHRTGVVTHWDFVHRNTSVSASFGTMSFPVTGQPSRVWVTQGSSTVVTDASYVFKMLHNGQIYGIGELNLEYTPDPENPVFPFLRNRLDVISTRVYPYAQEAVQKTYEVGGSRNGTFISQSTTVVNAIDNYGNATDVTTTTLDQDTLLPTTDRTFTTRVVQSINNNTTHWCLGRPHRTATTSTLGNGTSRTQANAQTIDYAQCRVTDEVTNVDTANQPTVLSVATHLEFAANACGRASSLSVTGRRSNGTALPPRTTSFDFGSNCLTPIKVTDPLGKSVTQTLNPAVGVVISELDANGRLTQFEPDAFGRTTKITLPDNTSTTVTLSACNVANNYCGVPDLRSRVDIVTRATDNTAISSATEYFDSFGRTRFSDRPLPLSGQTSHVVTTYDTFGRLKTRTVPYSNAYQGLTEYGYDLAGRQVSVKLFNGAGAVVRQSSQRYEGRRVVFVDPRNYERENILDAMGQVRRVKDPAGSSLTAYDYTYSGSNLVSTVTDNNLNQLVTTLDINGNRISTQDPDMGSWAFAYTSLGELTQRTDAKGQILLFADYDALGRPTTRTEAEGMTTFTYATPADNAYGQLKSISRGGYTETYLYDGLGRPSNTQITIPGEPVTYTIAYDYQPTTGLVDNITYPATTGPHPLKIKYGYAQGVVTSARDYTNNTLGTTYWQMTALDASGRTTDESLGNGVMRVRTAFDQTTGLMTSRQSGTDAAATNRQNLSYQWDVNGNLERRTDSNQSGLYEHFYYDALNRLDYSTRNGTTNLDLGYDGIGNITSKTGIGSYNYTSSQAGCSYYAHAQPHAVRNAGGGSYCYDANGNMTSRAGGTTITWYSDNSVKKITQGSMSSEFWYSPTGARFKQSAVYPTGNETTVYIGGLVEKATLPSGATAYRHYISAGSSVAIHTRWSTGTAQTVYATTDHLGSSSSIIDQSGNVVVRESFDAFGKRRATDWTAGAPSASDLTTIGNTTRMGYTGHEHLDNVGLIHMNGRVQDPSLGRFVSADPIIQAPHYSQSLNRYSYVWNNPLAMTDPSGYQAGGGSNCEVSPNDNDCGPRFSDWRPPLLLPPAGILERIRGMTFVASPGTPLYPGQTLPGPLVGYEQESWIWTPGGETEALEFRNGQAVGAGRGAVSGSWSRRLSSVGGVNGAQLEPPMEEPLRGGFADLLRQLNEWASPSRYVTEDGREIPFVTGMPPLPGAIGRATSAASAQNIVNGVRLSGQLTVSEATSVFTTGGRLSQGAINGATEIIPAGALGNPAIPAGFAKFTTETFKSPAGPFQVHFYMNPATREVVYGLDYKVIFNSGL